MSINSVSGSGAPSPGGPAPVDAALVGEMTTHSGRELAEALVAGESFAPGTMAPHVASLIHLLAAAGAEGITHGETMAPSVIKALREFQRAEGLPVTGEPDAATARALDRKLADFADRPDIKNANAWRKFDGETALGAKSGEIRHGRSAVDNLKGGAREIAAAPVVLAQGFIRIFGKKDMLDGTNSGILERLSNPLVGAFMAGTALFGGLKDVLIDAPAHAVAGLFDGKR